MPTTRISKTAALCPTRNEFVMMDFFDIKPGMKIRSLNYPKWIVESVDEHDIESLPKIKRLDFSSTREDELPPIFVINRARRPFCVIREV